ncbi:hypothetical protein OEZ86_006058 [Tetradesmus obliquus]|nr:hypothetical protein OEZ86_006058 [Tetradesmus obliquus]
MDPTSVALDHGQYCGGGISSNTTSKGDKGCACAAARSESWNTFSYITQQSHWNWAVQQSVRLAGAVLMWK